MPTSANINAIDSYETLRAEMIELFVDLSERMRVWDDKRPSRIMRKMAATINTVPHDTLLELGHSDPNVLCLMVALHCGHGEIPDFADAHALVLTILDDLQIRQSAELHRAQNISDLDNETLNYAEAILKNLPRSIVDPDEVLSDRTGGEAGRLLQAFGYLARLASIPV